MQTNETWDDLKKRARWDRIFGALAVLVMFLLLMISGISSCSKKLKEKEDAAPANVSETLPASYIITNPTEETVDHSKAIFLSPSTQEDNVYACDNTITEEAAMWMITRQLKDMLEIDGYEVYLCGEDDNVMQKVELGNSLECGAYVAIHSNSGGESGEGKGTEIFYNSNIAGSLALAEYIYNHVATLTPTDDRGVKDQTQRDLYEINNNQTACCLLEVEFHDDMTTSRWILDHTRELAAAIRDGILDYLNNPASVSNYADNAGNHSESETLPPFSGDGDH